MRYFTIVLVAFTFVFGGCAQKYVVTKQPAQTLIHVEGTPVTLKLPSQWEKLPPRHYPPDIDQIWIVKESKSNLIYPHIDITTYKGQNFVINFKSLIKSEQDATNFFKKAAEQAVNGGPVDDISLKAINSDTADITIKRKNAVTGIDEILLMRVFAKENTLFELRYTDRANSLSGYENDFYQMFE